MEKHNLPSIDEGFYLDFIQQRYVKSIHHKTENHISTPRNTTIGEKTCRQGPMPKNTNNITPANYRGITESPYGENHTSGLPDPWRAPHAIASDAVTTTTTGRQGTA
jgi:hypothetical protein